MSLIVLNNLKTLYDEGVDVSMILGSMLSIVGISS